VVAAGIVSPLQRCGGSMASSGGRWPRECAGGGWARTRPRPRHHRVYRQRRSGRRRPRSWRSCSTSPSVEIHNSPRSSFSPRRRGLVEVSWSPSGGRIATSSGVS
jgi:hypothetical protein